MVEKKEGLLQKRIRMNVCQNGFGHKYADDAWNAMKLGFNQILGEMRKDFQFTDPFTLETERQVIAPTGNVEADKLLRQLIENMKWFKKWLGEDQQ